jgi:mannose-6-phosphate isomerase-like protein (cupin superfamily)
VAIISGPGGIDLEAELAAIGVRFVHAPGEDAPASIIDEVLGPDERHVRAVVVAEPPGADDEFTGMGAWHVNSMDEVHFVRSGRGQLQFVLPQGVCSVEVMAGDVMVVRGAEHRYRPVRAQEWVIRHSGPAEGDLGARETGRDPQPWPHLPLSD